MKSNISIIWILLLPFLFLTQNCSQFKASRKNISPVEVDEEGIYNRGYRKGFKVGHKNGLKEGLEEGKQLGIKEGKARGKILGIDSLIRTQKKIGNQDEYLIYMGMEYPKFEQRIEEIQKAWERGYLAGEENHKPKIYAKGFDDGYNIAFDSLYNLRLAKGQFVTLNQFNEINLAIDYGSVARLIGTLDMQNTAVGLNQFSMALKEVHLTVLEYLAYKLNLNAQERSEVFERYLEIHNALTALYYEYYKNRCSYNKWNNYSTCYDYRYSTSINSFTSILAAGISGVADVTFTYAKGNSQYAAIAGLETMGHITELLIKEVFPYLENSLKQEALIIDYNNNIPTLSKSMKAILEPFVVETRTHRKKVKRELTFNSGYEGDIEMEIFTIVNLGFSTQDIEINVDHQKQNFHIYISGEPKLIEIVQQNYEVTSIDFKITCTEEEQEKVRLPKRKLDQIFEKNRDKKITTQNVCLKPLKKQSFDAFLPVIAKIFEPAISLPSSCYSVYLTIDGVVRNKKVI